VPASELRARIEATIARQAEGHYTLTEAAQILADTRGSLPESHLARLQQGWADGGLPVHQGGSRYLRKPGEAVCTFDDTVMVADLDEWLQVQTGRGFTVAAEATPTGGTGGPATQQPVPDRGRRVKRKALLSDNSRRWPTIERDLKDAASNGLSAAAKDESHGWWWEGSAREWARSHGKWKDEAAAMNPTSFFHQMRG
jgi:hypothetical protein